MLPHCGLMIPEKLRGKKKRWLKEGGITWSLLCWPPVFILFISFSLHLLSFKFFFRCLFVSPPFCFPLWAPLPSSPDFFDPLSSIRKWRICKKGGNRSKSCGIRQPARKRGVLSMGAVRGRSVGEGKKDGRAVGAWRQSLTVKTDSGEEWMTG